MCTKSIIWKIGIITLFLILLPVRIYGQTTCNDSDTQMIVDQTTVIPPFMCIAIGANTNPENNTLQHQELDINIEKNSIVETEQEHNFNDETVIEKPENEKNDKTKNNIISIVILAISYFIYKIFSNY